MRLIRCKFTEGDEKFHSGLALIGALLGSSFIEKFLYAGCK